MVRRLFVADSAVISHHGDTENIKSSLPQINADGADQEIEKQKAVYHPFDFAQGRLRAIGKSKRKVPQAGSHPNRAKTAHASERE